MPRSILLALSIVCLAIAPRAQAAETQPIPADLTELVRQLGADSFDQREEAGRKLSARGLAALPALKSGSDHSDVEVRTRCRRILASVLALDFENRMKAFLEDIEGKLEHKLPGWERYRKVVGEDKASRELFVEMLKTESALLDSSEKSPKGTGDKLAVACREMQQMLYNRFGQQNPMSIGSVATLFFVGSDPQVKVNDQTAAMVYQFVHQPALQQSLNGGAKSEQIRKLLGAWIGTRTGTNMAYQNIMLAMQYNLKEGLIPSLEMIKNPALDSGQRSYAMMAVGKLGSRDNVPALEALLQDTMVCAGSQVNGNRLNVEIRDVALGILVHLTGQNLKEYGFDRVQANPQMLYIPYTLGFSDVAKREAALKKWREWSAEQAAAKKS